MKFVFRVDASDIIGMGHVVRCLTLSDALKKLGANCEFICREHPGHLIEHIRSRGYVTHRLPLKENDLDSTNSAWLGATQQEDFQACAEILQKFQPAWLVVDHYSLDAQWEEALCSARDIRLMVIDDLADRNHYCDVLLDQNLGSSMARYNGLVPKTSMQLHGLEYALLKPAYRECRKSLEIKSGQIKRVFVYFSGGADQEDLTGRAVRALSHPMLATLDLDVVISPVYAHRNSLETAAKARGRVTVHEFLPDLSELMVRADLAIGAGGVTAWERCCLGLPSLVISIADNQKSACDALASGGFIEYLGSADRVSADLITGAILHLSKNPACLIHYAQASRGLVDGGGAERVALILLQDEIHNVRA